MIKRGGGGGGGGGGSKVGSLAGDLASLEAFLSQGGVRTMLPTSFQPRLGRASPCCCREDCYIGCR